MRLENNFNNLGKIIMLLEKGEDIIIAKAGNPVARLTAWEIAIKEVLGKLKQIPP